MGQTQTKRKALEIEAQEHNQQPGLPPQQVPGSASSSASKLAAENNELKAQSKLLEQKSRQLPESLEL